MMIISPVICSIFHSVVAQRKGEAHSEIWKTTLETAWGKTHNLNTAFLTEKLQQQPLDH